MPPVPCPEYLHESQVRRNHEKREKATALVALSSLSRRRNRLKRSYIVKICKLRPVKHYQLSTLAKYFCILLTINYQHEKSPFRG